MTQVEQPWCGPNVAATAAVACPTPPAHQWASGAVSVAGILSLHSSGVLCFRFRLQEGRRETAAGRWAPRCSASDPAVMAAGSRKSPGREPGEGVPLLQPTAQGALRCGTHERLSRTRPFVEHRDRRWLEPRARAASPSPGTAANRRRRHDRRRWLIGPAFVVAGATWCLTMRTLRWQTVSACRACAAPCAAAPAWCHLRCTARRSMPRRAARRWAA